MANSILIEAMFIKMDPKMNKVISGNDIRQYFMSMDRHGRNQIFLDDFQYSMKDRFGMTPERAEKMFEKMDRNGRGRITEEDVMAMFQGRDFIRNNYISKEEFIQRVTRYLCP